MKLENLDCRDHAPLLPEYRLVDDRRKHVNASISGAIFNISTGMVGAGIMSIPASFKVLGVIPSFMVILIIAYLVEIAVEFLLKYTRLGESNTYGELMAESFGESGAVAFQICVMITNLGALIIYLIIIGDVLSGNKSEGTVHLGILHEWFGVHWWNSRSFSLLFIVLFVLLPLLLHRRIDSLRHASAASVLLAGFFVAICSVLAIHALWVGKTQRPHLLPDFENENGVSLIDLFTTVPVFATAFGCHVNVHPVKAELSKPSATTSAVRISIVLCVAIYIAVGFFGYLLFGDAIASDMLVNFDQKTSDSIIATVLSSILRLSYAFHLVLVFPIMNYSLRINVDELIFPKKHSEKFRFYSVTISLLAIIYLAAIAVPNVWCFFQLIGTTTVMCLMFIFPSSIVLRDVRYISTSRDKALALLVILLAASTSFAAIFSNLSILFGKKL